MTRGESIRVWRRDAPSALLARRGILTLAIALTACTTTPADRDFHLAGAVEKGPFVTGSSVHVGTLDAMLFPTGQSFDTSTLDDLGTFQLLLPASAPVQIEGDGFYYDEASGALSTSRIVLRALYVPTDDETQHAYVNLVTHLTHARVRALVQSGTDFDAAVAQAEDELRAGLGITPPGFVPGRHGVALTIAGGDDDGNAYLFAVSTVIAVAAHARTGPADANLAELVNALSLDLSDGTITAATATELQTALAAIDTAVVEHAFAVRLAALGSSATVPDLDRVLDQDRDGLANAGDDCPRAADPDQADGDGDGVGDACDACPSAACADGCIPATATTPDVCVETCSELDACASAGDLCIAVGDPIDASTCASARVCATPCDPTDASSCEADETCELAKTSADAREYGWVCVPATPGAGAGRACRGGTIDGGCAHGLACDRGNLFGVELAATCTGVANGVCRAPCGHGAPACEGGEACTPRAWLAGSGMPASFPDVCDTSATPLAEGAPCSIDGTPCETSLFCDSTVGGVCTMRRAVGEACSADGECETGLVCDASHVCATH